MIRKKRAGLEMASLLGCHLRGKKKAKKSSRGLRQKRGGAIKKEGREEPAGNPGVMPWKDEEVS